MKFSEFIGLPVLGKVKALRAILGLDVRAIQHPISRNYDLFEYRIIKGGTGKSTKAKVLGLGLSHSQLQCYLNDLFIVEQVLNTRDWLDAEIEYTKTMLHEHTH